MSEIVRGYYRYPTIYKNIIIFVAEGDLWRVDRKGGKARRLSAHLSDVSMPHFSPNGEQIAFVGRDEGHPEIYMMPADGGSADRLTYHGGINQTVGWLEDRIIFASNFGKPFGRWFELYQIDPATREITPLNVGLAQNIAFCPDCPPHGRRPAVIGRHTGDPARWKRYRGGRAGVLWIDEKGDGQFRKLSNLEGNLASPMWIKERLYFISDHGGVGAICSCLPDGSDIFRHTNHNNFFVRNATTDGEHIVYHCGADIYTLNLESRKIELIQIEYASSQTQRNRKFVQPAHYLENYDISPDSSHLAVTVRGKPIVMGNWEGAALQIGIRQGARYKAAQWLNEGGSSGDTQRLIAACDQGGEYRLEIHFPESPEEVTRFDNLDVGIPYQIKVSPTNDRVAIHNHRHELVWVDTEKGEMTKIDRSEYTQIGGFDWSPDGRWIAYAVSVSAQTRVIKIYDLESGESRVVTDPVSADFSPIFDPGGKYLYFLSSRIFNPVYDQLHFDLSFPQGCRPYLIVLQEDGESPFVQKPRGLEPNSDRGKGDKGGEEQKIKPVLIDFDKIGERILPFPVSEGIYRSLAAGKDKVFYTTYPVQGALDRNSFSNKPSIKYTLKIFNMNDLEESIFVDRISSFILSRDNSSIVCRIGNRLRVISANRNPSTPLPKGVQPSRKSGWIDLSRVSLEIDPHAEWRQMFREIWCLQREFFWTEDMSDIDWQRVYDLYLPLVDRVNSRGEFSDLAWELQGELGTSHAYEIGGDYRPYPHYRIGFLGAEFNWDQEQEAYRISHILQGDCWSAKSPSPLKRPGLNIKEGMLLTRVNRQKVSRRESPNYLLVNQANRETLLTVADSDGSNPRDAVVRTIRDEEPLRYRDWVERNRRYVHEKTEGRVGYVHIPDMGPSGYAEFHRYFLAELHHNNLIVDVRFNRGGHVSGLLLEKLARKRMGHRRTRWMGKMTIPRECIGGSIVALTNEYAGSDGDIFSHLFKMMKLGKLVGSRTWGGVIGIWPRHWLTDGSLATQPEFSNWFDDVGLGVENYGTDPDIEVEIAPQDYAKESDPLLDKAIETVLTDMEMV